ncbi:unnamed protein product [Dibothriocephalus latus]|uniref:Uncharacterized protein n=1 Tax=Dibothriocephalus latus TaxID=60516 RepID=A0A3P7S4R0_DIBLA|nr:unnamed protein product [Dibothriocephalus latus]
MGIPIGYSSPQTLTDTSTRINHDACKGDLTVLRPTLFAGVPTVLDRISKAVWEKVKEGGPLMEAVGGGSGMSLFPHAFFRLPLVLTPLRYGSRLFSTSCLLPVRVPPKRE